MRLINAKTLEFDEFFDSQVPRYGILSHTWEKEEVTLRDMRKRPPSVTAKKGYRKVTETCRLALEHGLDWVWVDTCCIDKTSSAELTESINSMFRWYQQAAICFVYLSDLSTRDNLEVRLPACRWFTRGWTLQELIAPKDVSFYDKKWQPRGTKISLVNIINTITGISIPALKSESRLSRFSVAKRMSWAARRTTTRAEDTAYSLLGIFDVNMPLIYGEGINAFRRLQEEIMRKSSDVTILAWEDTESTWENTLFAPSPAGFTVHMVGVLGGRSTSSLYSDAHNTAQESSMTNRGWRIETRLLKLSDKSSGNLVYLLKLGVVWVQGVGETTVGITLEKVGPHLFTRQQRSLTIVLPTLYTIANPPLLTCRQNFFIARDAHDWENIEEFELHEIFTFPCPVEKAIPESYWDESSRIFYRSPQESLAFSALVTKTVEGLDLQLLVLIDQGLEVPKAYLLYPPKNPGLMEWFNCDKAAREPHSLSELTFQLGKDRPTLSEKIEIIVDGSPLWVSVRLVDNFANRGPFEHGSALGMGRRHYQVRLDVEYPRIDDLWTFGKEDGDGD
ncbi:heterokaryon incompatibility protein-domain-containing protein [Lasiosphaeria ovina]|uniref:Heterokaryon incompatibility protein-domain-containing protein n=1 Tax=Lasiosphaeria ovina TaxID=92902 RepID=A0AAE0NM49_9PEZI|nr:heterokaryon incompatibility protein-domain-containing protein [Lasiosphaeria ovina]